MRRPFNGAVNITQEYGTKTPGSRRGYHTGVDYGLPIGTPIVAPTSGKVTYGDGRAPSDGRGYFAQVLGNDGVQHNLYHLSGFQGGSRNVSEGEVIGYSGNTGQSTGPHLHWETRKAPYDGNSDFPPAQWLFAGQTTAPTPAPQPQGLGTLHLPPVPAWRVYPLNKAPVIGNEVGKLAPAQFGGLSYAILARPQANVATIQTRDFGRVNIWIAPDTGATIS